ncbi:universal stress protein [Tuwongella immobilis]|uniref:UspA domain-containing protein n=1 Tax=Tuwongella immobilis TaxID=692036 RepID=A0A6C2YKR2_9BACT|nr:universal stress protein [Tuwongella immobilis]VIP01964.1 universal stress protein : Universal stress protein UspA-like protein OS=Singulisphaera acidiphila (strain ATCC BAA-1392 / DSM 18658 / VKM B-2454 / MOB10) GN=Sinac_2531 PE=4 SV=1: Usp: Usp [Tuwongella immobilis]VTR99979.1 universal stress protein : Universal stress protein UspA-like protein OS=Singulisphaera acidiphila (strain ATCC BAA-1392 / DSM 18658 / VKM B-2454 / MOB10) GN=Sinac_2531 PE=4 SV=1: Usp: Usp [Tuwongella immobilis]
MLKSILIGLDGTAWSSRAIELGIQLAQTHNALLVGQGIIDEPTILGPEPTPLGAGAFKEHADSVRLERAVRQVERYLESFSLKCAEAGVASKPLEDRGSPPQVLLRQAQRFDLLLLGQETHFRFATQESNCETLNRVLHSMPRPVVVVPKRPASGDSILIAYDGSLQSARTLQAFTQLGLASGKSINIVSIHRDVDTAIRCAEIAIDYLNHHGIAAKNLAIESSDSPASVLLDAIAQTNAEMIVSGAYGQSVIREFFLGSVTQTLLAESPVPLFLYH